MINRPATIARAARGPILLITVGTLFALHQANVLSFERTWPLLIIVLGIMRLIERSFGSTVVSQAPGYTPGYASGFAPTAATPVPPLRLRGTRYSVAGPLILIIVGALFLAHTLSPGFEVIQVFARFWPYILILWGLLQLVEIAALAMRSGVGQLPYNGVSGGGWFVALLICFVGFTMFEVDRPTVWWHHFGFEPSLEMFGNEHTYSVPPIQRTVNDAPHVIIENFRGDAKITGSTGSMLTVSGSKVVRAMNDASASDINRQTPVEVALQGQTVVVRCNQEHTGQHASVTTNLELSVPRNASVEVTGTYGDFEIASLKGNVDLNSENAGVRVEDVDGDVHINTRKSDDIRCSNIGGEITLRGRGTDVGLSKVNGEVTVNGEYTGVVELEAIAKPVRVESMRTTLDLRAVQGGVKLARGSLAGHGLMGPVKVTTRSTDVTLTDYSNDLELNVDKGDIDLRPGHLPLGKMAVHTGSGDIDLALPSSANFSLMAVTDHGDIDSELGPSFSEHTEGNETRLEGATGSGPEVNVTTNRGDINARHEGKPQKEHSEPEHTPDNSQQSTQL